LQGWHDGDNSWGSDPHAQIMPAIATRLTSADIAAVASYVEGLHTAQPGEQVSGPEAAPATAPASASSAPAKAGSAAQPASGSSKH